MEQAIRINVAKRQPKPGWNGKPTYRHHCAVSVDHLSNLDDVHALIQQLRAAFPEGDYHITATRWVHRGEGLNIEGCDRDR
ncbi:hypothetical protein CJ97_gp04 [Ralstonia phage RSB2]|uniref:Uncharacterized protein ORF4 n=1 Tax=Ralstonia phage RSB2 TaxID=913183 RepID=E5RUY4_9CAUD|nr:hypothetical protein CJ97_gp04 [Ralstonia phage RSB2]BAJ51792.1 hypothetical protein [Ralstonia phage RSB2]